MKLGPELEARLEDIMMSSRKNISPLVPLRMTCTVPAKKSSLDSWGESERQFELADCFLVVGENPKDLLDNSKELEMTNKDQLFFSPKVLQKVDLSEYGSNLDQYPRFFVFSFKLQPLHSISFKVNRGFLELLSNSLFPNYCTVERAHLNDSMSFFTEVALTPTFDCSSCFSLAMMTKESFEESFNHCFNVYSVSNPLNMLYVIAIKAPEFIDIVSFFLLEVFTPVD